LLLSLCKYFGLSNNIWEHICFRFLCSGTVSDTPCSHLPVFLCGMCERVDWREGGYYLTIARFNMYKTCQNTISDYVHNYIIVYQTIVCNWMRYYSATKGATAGVQTCDLPDFTMSKLSHFLTKGSHKIWKKNLFSDFLPRVCIFWAVRGPRAICNSKYKSVDRPCLH